jgi:hypothetical protein
MLDQPGLIDLMICRAHVMALPLDDPLVHVVQQNPTTVKVGHVGIVCGTWTGYLMIISMHCLLIYL